MVDDVKAVAKTDHAPIIVHNACRLARAAGAGPGAVILEPAHHVVKWEAIVCVRLIKLPGRDVVDGFPALAAVVRDGKTSVLPVPHAFRILWIEPERVIVDVRASRDRAKGLAAIH